MQKRTMRQGIGKLIDKGICFLKIHIEYLLCTRNSSKQTKTKIKILHFWSLHSNERKHNTNNKNSTYRTYTV